MFVIDPKSQKIKLTRGDTATIYVEVYDLDNKKYEIQSDDIVTFTMRQTSSSPAVLTKYATEDHYIIIDSEDTVNFNSGLYRYDVQIETAEGFIYTIIQNNYLELMPDITR